MLTDANTKTKRALFAGLFTEQILDKVLFECIEYKSFDLFDVLFARLLDCLSSFMMFKSEDSVLKSDLHLAELTEPGE